jgi:hypothetical protein
MTCAWISAGSHSRAPRWNLEKSWCGLDHRRSGKKSRIADFFRAARTGLCARISAHCFRTLIPPEKAFWTGFPAVLRLDSVLAPGPWDVLEPGTLNAAIATIASVKPQTELEALLAVQIVAFGE